MLRITKVVVFLMLLLRITNLYQADLLYLTSTSADEIHDGMNLELYYQ